jgi:hypothetical protein
LRFEVVPTVRIFVVFLWVMMSRGLVDGSEMFFLNVVSIPCGGRDLRIVPL